MIGIGATRDEVVMEVGGIILILSVRFGLIVGYR